MKILLVEDNPDDLILIEEQLEGWEVVNAGRLSEALEILDEDTERREIGLVLTDLNLPDAEGLETVRVLLRHRWDVPVVAITGLEDEKVAVAVLEAGARDWISKSDALNGVRLRTIARTSSVAHEAALSLKGIADQIRGLRLEKDV